MDQNYSHKSFRFPVFFDDDLHPAGSAFLALEDQGFQLGLAVFETLLVQAGHAYFLEAHVERLEQGAGAIGISWVGQGVLRAAVNRYVRAIEALPAAPPSYALRITYSSGVPGGDARWGLSARELAPLPEQGAQLWLSSMRVIGDDLTGLKATSRLRHVMARREALAQGCYDALLLNTEDELAEGTISNVFLYKDGVLSTPPLAAGCLGGIMRQHLLADLQREAPQIGGGRFLALACEPLRLEQLRQADEVFLSNSTGRLIPICRILGAASEPQSLPGGAGALVARLSDRIAALEERDRLRGQDGYTGEPVELPRT